MSSSRDHAGQPATRAVRSMLFVPGHRPAMIVKALRAGADATVLDWEDAVPPEAKAEARTATATALADIRADGVFVRVNPSGSPEFADDIEAALALPIARIVLPKAERPTELREIRARAEERGRPLELIAGIETALGVADCRDLLNSGVTAAYFGAEDYIADIGGIRTDHGDEVLYARSQVVLAGRLAGIPTIDQAVVAFRDDALFRADADLGRSLGYQGKICIHPRQVELAHQLFTPSADELTRAHRVLELAGAGAAVLDGQMIDAVHVNMARAVLARAGLAPEAAKRGGE